MVLAKHIKYEKKKKAYKASTLRQTSVSCKWDKFSCSSKCSRVRFRLLQVETHRSRKQNLEATWGTTQNAPWSAMEGKWITLEAPTPDSAAGGPPFYPFRRKLLPCQYLHHFRCEKILAIISRWLCDTVEPFVMCVSTLKSLNFENPSKMAFVLFRAQKLGVYLASTVCRDEFYHKNRRLCVHSSPPSNKFFFSSKWQDKMQIVSITVICAIGFLF